MLAAKASDCPGSSHLVFLGLAGRRRSRYHATATSARMKPRIASPYMCPVYAPPGRAIMVLVSDEGGPTMAKAKDKGGDKNVKRVAQKSIKEKRAAKKAKKQAASGRTTE